MKRSLLLGLALFAVALPVAAQGGLDPATKKKIAARSDAILSAFDAMCLKATTRKSSLVAAGAFGATEQAGKTLLADTREYPVTVDGAPAKLAVRGDYSCVLTVDDIDTEVFGERFDAMLRRRPGAKAEPLDEVVWSWEALHRVASWPRAGGKSPWRVVLRSSIESGKRFVRVIRSDRDEVVVFDDPSPVAVAVPPPPPPPPAPYADRAPVSVAPPPPPPPMRTPTPTTDSYSPYEVLSGREHHPPRIPASATAACAHGVTRLRVTVDQRSKVLDVAVQQTSGNTDLDAAAVEAARHWAYLPGRFRGEPIGGDVVVPVLFENPCK